MIALESKWLQNEIAIEYEVRRKHFGEIKSWTCMHHRAVHLKNYTQCLFDLGSMSGTLPRCLGVTLVIVMTSWWAPWRLISPASTLSTYTFIEGADQRKHKKFRVAGLCVGNSPAGEFPAQMASDAGKNPFDGAIMTDTPRAETCMGVFVAHTVIVTYHFCNKSLIHIRVDRYLKGLFSDMIYTGTIKLIRWVD